MSLVQRAFRGEAAILHPYAGLPGTTRDVSTSPDRLKTPATGDGGVATATEDPALRDAALAFLAGGGEMGARMRAFDWGENALGLPEGWPQSLKTAIRILLLSRQPMWIGWGADLMFFYNDPYKAIIGGKHPGALGQPTALVWQEIWEDIGPMLAQALTGVEGTYVEGQLLIMERNGYPEETYYTFSYSPIPDDDGNAGGIICANTDDTQRVIGERQLALLRDLAAGTADARSRQEVAARSVRVLAENMRDLPFALLYLIDPSSGRAVLEGASGVAAGHPLAPHTLDPADTPWPISGLPREGEVVSDLQVLFGDDLPCGPWDTPPTQALALPVAGAGEGGADGLLVAGLNPYRLLDDGYRRFLGLVAGQIAGATANAEAYAAERRRAEALAELDRAKTAFFSNVSHEFRTPLTLMLGPLEEALAGDRLDARDRQELDVVHRNALRLLRLVNTLLDFSRVEAGRAQAVYEPVDLAALTADLASNFRSACERAGLTLTVDCAPLPEAVHVDRGMWERIVLNLVSNAFKFTFEGEIEVAVRAEGREAVLTVRDTGTGIPEEELPRIFDRFHRVENARGRTFEGTGIGLALVQELARLHGGAASVASVLDEGTTFTVRIPFGTAHLPRERATAASGRGSTPALAEAFVQEALRWLPDAAAAPAGGEQELPPVQPPAQPAGGERARVVLADDNADMRDYVQRLLVPRFDVVGVGDGLRALEAIRARRPDIVVSDVMMPQLDGFGLLAAIRADPGLRDLPVILLSARAGEEALVDGVAAGADDYLTKPFGARELIARVEANLALARLRQETTAALRASEAKFRLMADNAPVMIRVTEPDGSCSFLSRTWNEFTGQTEGEGAGSGWLAPVHPEDRPGVARRFAEAHAPVGSFRAEYRLRRADGVYRWVIDAAAPRLREDGGFLGYIGSVMDITDRREVEEALQESEARCRRLLEAMPQLVWRAAPDGRITYYNSRIAAFHGAPSGDAGQWDWSTVLHEEDRAPTTAAWQRAVEARADYQFMHRLRMADGAFRWHLSRATPILDDTGALLEWFGTATDIDDLQRVQEEVLRTSTLLRLIGDSTPNLLYAKNRHGRMLYVNAAVPRVVGRPAEEILGASDAEFLPDPVDAVAIQANDRRVLTDGETLDVDEQMTGRDGRTGWYRSVKAPLRDARGRIIGLVGITSDMTARREAEERERLLSREIDHRAKNMLAVVHSLVQMTRADDVAGLRAAITGRIQSLARVHSLLAAGRWEGVDLPTLVREELAAFAGQDTARVTAAGPALNLKPAAAQALALVLHELATNAAKYGALSVGAGRLDIAWELSGGLGSGGRLTLHWQERGGPPVVPPARSGFGSTVIRASVERQLQGTVTLEWLAGGLCCVLSIPADQLAALHERDAEDGPSAGAPVAPVGKGAPVELRRVLVVEDEALIAMQLEEVVREAACAVLGPAATLVEALRLAGSQRVDAAILDVNLGGEHSFPLAEVLTAQRVPFVFCTGYIGVGGLPERFRHVPVIAKPFSAGDIQGALRRLWAGPS